jgi:hypothetical protein
MNDYQWGEFKGMLLFPFYAAFLLGAILSFMWIPMGMMYLFPSLGGWAGGIGVALWWVCFAIVVSTANKKPGGWDDY